MGTRYNRLLLLLMLLLRMNMGREGVQDPWGLWLYLSIAIVGPWSKWPPPQ